MPKTEGSPAISIDSYIKQIVGDGISASNLFEFAIQPTEVMRDFWADNGKDYPWYSNSGSQMDAGMYRMNLLCQDIQIPGSTFNSIDVRMPKKGLTQKMASAKMFNELDVSFICDLGSTPIAFFKMWQDMTIGIQPGQAAPEPIYSKDSRYHNLPHMAVSYTHLTLPTKA